MAFAIENRFKEVQKLVSSAQARDTESEVAAYFCKLGSVLICGTIERSVEILVTERMGNRSAPQVLSFLKSYFKRGTNYDCDEIMQLLYKFDSNWGREFKVFLDSNEQIKSDISSCYAIRNSISHGGTQSLSPKTLKQYFDSSFSLVAALEGILRS